MDSPWIPRDCEPSSFSKHRERRPADGERYCERTFSRGYWNNTSRQFSLFYRYKMGLQRLLEVLLILFHGAAGCFLVFTKNNWTLNTGLIYSP
jgi:hypothetical protein